RTDEVVDRWFARTPAAVDGIGWGELEREALARLAASREVKPALENPGYVKFRKGGEPHATTPDVVDGLHETAAVAGRNGFANGKAAAHVLRKAVRSGDGWALYERFA